MKQLLFLLGAISILLTSCVKENLIVEEVLIMENSASSNKISVEQEDNSIVDWAFVELSFYIKTHYSKYYIEKVEEKSQEYHVYIYDGTTRLLIRFDSNRNFLDEQRI